MWMIVVAAIVIAVGGVAAYIIRSSHAAEERKYYDAAYKMIKESYLDRAINRNGVQMGGRQKVMLYLKWKDVKKQGFVFDPEKGVRIGRIPDENDICVRENSVSGRQCVLMLSEGRPAIQDCGSTNGTWVKRGMRKHPVQGAELIFTGDQLLVGSIRIKITIFTFDMADV